MWDIERMQTDESTVDMVDNEHVADTLDLVLGNIARIASVENCEGEIV